MKKQKKIIQFSGTTLIISCIFLTSCNNSANKAKADVGADSLNEVAHMDSMQNAIKAMKIQDSTATNWQYSQETDAMTSKVMYFATIEAKEELQLSAPYDGGSTVTLEIRYKDGENNLMLTVKPAQFMSNVIDGENIRIRFDQEQPIVYNCGEPSDGSTTTLFINQSNSVIAKLKKAKTVLIQAEFYQDGLREMKFNTEGLVWNHQVK